MEGSVLTVGSHGIDRVGEYEVVGVTPQSITYRYLTADSWSDPKVADRRLKERIHQNILQERMPRVDPPTPATKVRACLRECEIAWSGEVAYFIGYLTARGDARLYLETTDVLEQHVSGKYKEITGEILLPSIGVFNIAPPQKWGTEASVYFIPAEGIPFYFDIQQEKPGQINRVELFWALIRLGFRLGKRPNSDAIRLNVPQSFQNEFDAGRDTYWAYTPMGAALAAAM